METNLNTKENIEVINILRGISALFVCLYHFVCTTINFLEGTFLYNICKYLNNGVNIFFIISGIVIPLSMYNNNYELKKAGKFLLKRILRIEPPYLMSIVLFFVYAIVRNFIPSSQGNIIPDAGNTLLHIGYLVPFFENSKWMNPVYWTLAIEFQYYIFICLVFPLIFNKNKSIIYIAVITMLCLPFIIKSQNHFPYWISHFMIGIIYVLYQKNMLNKAETLLLTALCFLEIIVLKTDLEVLFTLTATVVIYNWPNLKNKAGEFMGKISYSLYLIHSIVGASVLNFLSHKVNNNSYKYMLIVLVVAFTIFSANLFCKLIEMPSIKWSKKIKLNGN